MLNFRELKLEDKEKLEPYLTQDGAIMADRCFAGLYIWRAHYGVQICLQDAFLFCISKKHKNRRTYYMPLGTGDFSHAMDLIEEDSREKGPYHIVLFTKAHMEELQRLRPGKYLFTEDRDNFDYIYNASDLMELKGKAYHAKRNYINRFLTQYNGRWRYEDIDPQLHRDKLHEYTISWGRRKSGDGYEDDYKHELAAIDCALTNYEALSMRGGILWIDDTIAAYTLGAIAGEGIMDVMFEKADADIDGAYPMINHQFAIHNFSDLKLINREEDMGIEGLRRAKLSYNPAFLTDKYILTPAEDM